CFYWELHVGGGAIQAVRFGDWKAVKNGPSAAIELYDLQADPGETPGREGPARRITFRALATMVAAPGTR
ncbi:MAG: N-acetylgalactosamine 6-sulfate sulfatase, partial [Acidobacteria bacterium]|nr:N-acetylgalactosamine 6-sulfate sulfatase [Acidobacteriota bacterium]